MMLTERPEEHATTNPTSPLRILIADDMAQVRQDLRLLLELTGKIEIVGEAANGRQALELAERLHPDVVVMDLVMPVMDGVAATREIKRRSLAARIVILSVHGDAESEQCAREAGADALVVKGAPMPSLLNAIHEPQDWSIT